MNQIVQCRINESYEESYTGGTVAFDQNPQTIYASITVSRNSGSGKLDVAGCIYFGHPRVQQREADAFIQELTKANEWLRTNMATILNRCPFPAQR